MSDYVTVSVGSELYALPVENVLEVAEDGGVAPVPRGGRALLGVRNLRGEVLPVFDLATVLERPGEGTGQRHVVLEHEGRRAGLSVDHVDDVGPLAGALEESDSALLIGAVLGGGRLIGVLDVPRLVEKLVVGS